MNQSGLRLNLSEFVSTSVVAVEDRSHGEYWTGSIIHKSDKGIFILTQKKFIKRGSELFVHLHDNTVVEAERLLLPDPSSTFALLYVEVQHTSCTAISFRVEDITFSEALCVIPMSVEPVTKFRSVPGVIPVPSCQSNGAKRQKEGSNGYFLFMCHETDTPTITPAAVFHRDRGAMGFIIRDCAVHGDENKIDTHMKICIKSVQVENWLKKISGQEDWKVGLEQHVDEKETKIGKDKDQKGKRKRK